MARAAAVRGFISFLKAPLECCFAVAAVALGGRFAFAVLPLAGLLGMVPLLPGPLSPVEDRLFLAGGGAIQQPEERTRFAQLNIQFYEEMRTRK